MPAVAGAVVAADRSVSCLQPSLGWPGVGVSPE